MVTCTKCSTQNSLDSSFCKHCGEQLADTTLEEARKQYSHTLTQAYVAFNDKRTDEALAIAEIAVVDDPANHDALALRAMCLERKGQLADALGAYEAVLALNPDSALDQIKVDQLRHLIANQISDEREERRATKKMTIGVSVALAVTVFAIGWIIDDAIAGHKDASQAVASNAGKSQTRATMSAFDTLPTQAQPAASGNAQPQRQTEATDKLPTPTPPTGDDGAASQWTSQNGGTVLPPVPTANTSANAVNPTVAPVAPGDIRIEPSGYKSTDPDPQPIAPQNGQPPNADQAPPDDAVYEISVTSPVKANQGGSEGASPNELQSILRKARNEYQAGSYRTAATGYERALAVGADPASTNQRLAQCYEKMGRSQDAAGSYHKAIDAYGAQLRAGKGDSAALNAGLQACKMALRLLGG